MIAIVIAIVISIRITIRVVHSHVIYQSSNQSHNTYITHLILNTICIHNDILSNNHIVDGITCTAYTVFSIM